MTRRKGKARSGSHGASDASRANDDSRASDASRANDDSRANEEGERPPMPSGHPVAWQVLIEGTLLAGTVYPLPVFL